MPPPVEPPKAAQASSAEKLEATDGPERTKHRPGEVWYCPGTPGGRAQKPQPAARHAAQEEMGACGAGRRGGEGESEGDVRGSKEGGGGPHCPRLPPGSGAARGE